MTEQMFRVWDHYKRCKATMNFGDDELVAECAARIADAEEAARNSMTVESLERQANLIVLGLKRRG